MGNKSSSTYTKLKDKGNVCIVFPCYLAINKITHRAKCVCYCGRKSDNPDDMVVFINRFYLPDKKIGFYFFKPNYIYEDPFVLEDSLITMYPAPYSISNEEFEKIITKNLYDAIVERYNWLYDTDGKEKNKNNENWSFVWTMKQKKELTILNVFQ